MQYKNSIKTAEWGNVGVLAILSKQQLSSAYKFPLKFSITFFSSFLWALTTLTIFLMLS